MRISLLAVIFSIIISASFAGYAEKQPIARLIQPFEAEYTFYYRGDALGKGIRKLQYLDDGTLKYSYHSDAKWLIFSDQRDEVAIVDYQNHQLLPKYYRYQRSGTGKDKSYEWLYDRANNKAKDTIKDKTIQVDFTKPIYDSLSYHLQQRINLKKAPLRGEYRYQVLSTSGKLSTKTYQYVGEEQIKLPIGTLTTLHFKREVPSKRRVTNAWFAKDYDYLLVKLNQYKKNKQQFEIQLNSAKINNKPLQIEHQ